MRHHPACRAVSVEAREDRADAASRRTPRPSACPGCGWSSGGPRRRWRARRARTRCSSAAGCRRRGCSTTCWDALRPGGRLVANAVTVEGEAALAAARAAHGGTLRRIAVERAEPVGRFAGWRALAGVTQLVHRKDPDVTVRFVGAGPGRARPDHRARPAGDRAPARCASTPARWCPTELLAQCPPGARRVDTARMTLDEIIAELVAAHDGGARRRAAVLGRPGGVLGGRGADAPPRRGRRARGRSSPACPRSPPPPRPCARELTVPGVGQSVVLTRDAANATPMPTARSRSTSGPRPAGRSCCTSPCSAARRWSRRCPGARRRLPGRRRRAGVARRRGGAARDARRHRRAGRRGRGAPHGGDRRGAGGRDAAGGDESHLYSAARARP